ncbi:MAG: hypothetical protein AB7T49_18690 [Oligoflexales bacterium]
MLMWRLFVFAVLAVVELPIHSQFQAQAEPWLASRYAQNCAACHAPGRKNLRSQDRRCSATCQSCHVNPNGGGLRSFYGKWNENRWLRSWGNATFKSEEVPAPLKEQPYAGKRKRKAKRLQRIFAKGFVMEGLRGEPKSENPYNRDHDSNYQTPARNRYDFLYSIPQHDPYRQLVDLGKIDGGSDIRFATIIPQSTQSSQGPVEKEKTRHFIMSADFGIRWRPVNRRYHLVYETRWRGDPTGDNLDAQVTANNLDTRSLYFLAEDLPYNMFVMAGYYRPLFGNYVPDHTTLGQRMMAYILTDTPMAYSFIYRAISVGAAPFGHASTIPYFNLHYIGDNVGPGAQQVKSGGDNTNGYAANIGMRFVSYGASVNYSLWRTKHTRDNVFIGKVDILMHAFGMMGQLLDKRLFLSLEAISMEKDDVTESFRKGGVIILDSKYRMWRELWATLEYSKANTSHDLKPGSANQLKAGVRMFMIPGIDYSFQYTKDANSYDDPEADSRKTAYLISQLHTYF